MAERHADPRNQLRQILFDARTEAGLSLRAVGERLGRPHTFVGKIENGTRSIDVIEFIELSRALGVEPTKLLAKVIRLTDL